MKRNLSLIGLLALMLMSFGAYAQQTYTMITSASELEAGGKYLIVGFMDDGSAYAMGYQKTNNRFALNVAENGGAVTVTVATDPTSQTEPFEFEMGGGSGAWTLYDALNDGYLYAGASDANKLKTQTTNDANGEWDITISGDGAAVPVAQGANTRNIMRFNGTDPANVLFNCYASNSSIIAPVYFFKAGGSPVIDPEPSNYPTDLTTVVNRVSITLNWMDATGSQLPRAYLLLGTTGTITVPVDGTPVANDTDASDGNVAYNVNQGNESFTFEGLNPNTEYKFAIFSYTNSGSNIDYKTDGTYPTANATTDNIAGLLNESFTSDLGVFTAYDVYGEQAWFQATFSGKTYANMNGYADGTQHANEDWLISPNLFANGAYAKVYLSFESAFKFDGDALQLMVSTDYDGSSEPSEYTWTNLTSHFAWSDGNNYNWVESGEKNLADLTNIEASKLYIAFKYISTDSDGSHWEITNIKAFGDEYLSVGENHTESVSVYPNPVNDMLRFNAKTDANVNIMDISGRTIQQEFVNVGAAVINVSSLEKGVYFINVEFVDGTKAVNKFVKM